MSDEWWVMSDEWRKLSEEWWVMEKKSKQLLGFPNKYMTKMSHFNTLLTHFFLFYFLFPTQFHFINILLIISFYFTNNKRSFFHFTIIKSTTKKKKKKEKKRKVEMKKISNVQWRIKQLFCKVQNFILLNSYLFFKYIWIWG